MDQRNGHDTDPNFKGKGKEASAAVPTGVDSETNTQRQQADGDAQSEPSFANRLATSAANLSRAALTGRPDAESIRGGTSAKVYAQAEASTNSAHDSVNQGQAATYRGAGGHDTGIGSTFSSSPHSITAGEQQYDSFMGARATLDSSVQIRIPDNARPGLAGPASTSHSSRSLGTQSDVREQEARDGQQVIDLLSAPGELGGFEAIDDSLQNFISQEEEESLRKALFSGSGDGPTSYWTPLLDFQPDFLQGGNVTELLQHFGVADPQQARVMWMDSWNDVLASYTDQVWGDLGSLAREAQREIQEAREQGTTSTADPSGMQALQRLRQILAHIRGHSLT
ncbi:hypothetical protein ColTof4_04717 [Colletotrichum tofieldiae]|uniref:Uncharacterized protein n=1 Tax=Colletotrichum tofieldiae TaxID=708197 RepID=A0A166UIM4_9PEZI|nr:hypothetical protein CT0861_07553 [Colletotrichum tofieldiae]GKT63700.1 hypothetical protein ColTof3_11039 [Colletotrichum tofieldiae]GKT72294.1 hypothetical protein ColTof4_04717 [Colletotrichum tofieldiae]GKT89889.1 hypothetical protein Ct61P_07739 [Colletotrichum tofieldiae]